MKRNKSKITSWIWLSVICVLFAGCIFAAFVPFNTKNGRYNGFFGAQSYSTDLSDRIIVDYKADLANATDAQIATTCREIESFLHKNGFMSAKAKAVGDSQIEVTMSKPTTGDELKSAISLLSGNGVGVGAFEIRNTTSSSDEALIVGSKHVKSISTTTNSNYHYTVVSFNDEGKKLIDKYESTASSPEYYIYFGGQIAFGKQNFAKFFVGSDLYIGGFSDASTASTYELLIKMGSLPVSLSAIEASDITYQTNSSAQETKILLWSLCLAVVVAFLVWAGVRHGAYAFLAMLFANGITISIALLLASAMQWIELSGIAIAAFAICLAVQNACILSIFERMLAEHKIGKSMQMCIESGMQDSYLPVSSVCGLMLVLGLFVAVAFGGAVCAAASIIAIFGVLSCIATLVIANFSFKWLVSVGVNNKHTSKLGDEE